ncbi:lipoprotein LipL46 [Leptospira ognonensis]|uniref:Lipoprotein LipL46 n=1 Tax=Leptospira ognonensis TaxID=2484945 RepID=A0A4V3JRE2_9LEPT|nr:lipoprotein LipL46 [Leptospira ognonensis]TGL59665.1 lipoprotein LipL46 [Leptospira ognonensis]
MLKRILPSLIPGTFLLLILSCASPAGAEKTENLPDNVVTAMGEAPIYQGDLALARNKALKDAKLNAIRKLVGEQITEKSGVSDGQSLGSKLYGKTDSFVKKYEIISESTWKLDTQDMIRLNVRCEVEATKLSTAVDALLDDVGNPRIAVLVQSTIQGRSYPIGSATNIAEAELIEKLRNKGNKVVDSSQLTALLKKNPALAKLDLNSVEEGSPLLSLAQESGAEVLIIGRVETVDQKPIVLPGGKKTDFLSAAATGPYRIIQLWGDGKIFGSGSHEGRGADITQEVSREQATKDWAKLVSEKVAKQIKDEWFKLTEQNTVILKFKGLELEDAINFKNDLSEYTSVKQINDRKTDVNNSEWELTYPGKETMFAEELMYKKDSSFRFLSKKVLNMKSSKRGVVEIEFKNK